jgi:hypothetical protein
VAEEPRPEQIPSFKVDESGAGDSEFERDDYDEEVPEVNEDGLEGGD